jgi:hypothetical protein
LAATARLEVPVVAFHARSSGEKPILVREHLATHNCNVRPTTVYATSTEPVAPAVREEAGWFDTAEAFCGLAMAGMFGTALVFIACGVMASFFGRPTTAHTTVSIIVWVVLMAAELVFLNAALRFYNRREYPLPARLALSQPRWPVVLRPVVAAWWVAHTVGLLVLAHLAQRSLLAMRPPEWGENALRWGLLVGVMFGAAYATNIYVMLTISTVRRSEKAVGWVWRMRLPLDLAIAAGLLLSSRFAA